MPRETAKLPLFFDIETIPSPDINQDVLAEVAGILPAIPETPDSKMPAAQYLINKPVGVIEQAVNEMNPGVEYLERLRDAEMNGKARKTIVQLIADKIGLKSSGSEFTEDECLLLSTTPEYCSVVALACGKPERTGDGLMVDVYSQPQMSEQEILGKFWLHAADCDPLVGFNVIAFDLPVILTRSMMLGVDTTRTIDLSPYANNSEVVDLYLKRFGPRGKGNKKQPGRQVHLAKCYGIQVRDDLDGADVYNQWRAEEYEKIKEHVVDDVRVSAALYAKMRGYFC